MAEKFHRAFGVYGIIGNQDGLVVIKKNGGPYINRYDLPGGSLEDGEPLNQAISREIKEETGLTVKDLKQLGVTSFRYPWDFERWHYNQHICVFYEVLEVGGQLQNEVGQFEGQDSLGARKVALEKLTGANCSPLVLKAKEYLQTGKDFKTDDTTFKEWEVLTKPVY
ncbi:NUDIX family hydrolase [Ligilactobacillus salitolerans]|uniref:NUDIX family hydrolase n=1 Tax=Ligilactobacillus salitolerans TaxID=1808352 RepID=A0A401IPV8_9LACO|nr:NUDIX hydrolase [Ligilactobacillus salitolerans]GBG93577.1 NUDIX family hydrolase [Ligilactobacillus salitolerans]